jgi:hypothetical protein
LKTFLTSMFTGCPRLAIDGRCVGLYFARFLEHDFVS